MLNTVVSTEDTDDRYSRMKKLWKGDLQGYNIFCYFNWSKEDKQGILSAWRIHEG